MKTKKQIKKEYDYIKSVGRRDDYADKHIWYNGLAEAMAMGNWYGWTDNQIIDKAYQLLNR